MFLENINKIFLFSSFKQQSPRHFVTCSVAHNTYVSLKKNGAVNVIFVSFYWKLSMWKKSVNISIGETMK